MDVVPRDTILCGDALETLRTLPDGCVQTVVTSPPYWGLRDYGVAGQLGLERTPDEYVARLVEIFADVRRVLRHDGTLWLNLGDSYAGSWGNYAPGGIKGTQRAKSEQGKRWERPAYGDTSFRPPTTLGAAGLKPKDLCMIPARVALALQADGWWIRAEIVWAKSNPMPESVRDRPTRSHEMLYLLAKSERYYYDAQAVTEPLSAASHRRLLQPTFAAQKGGTKDYGAGSNRSMRRALENLHTRMYGSGNKPLLVAAEGERGRLDTHLGSSVPWVDTGRGRNKRDVWTVSVKPYRGAHFATFPPALIEPCVLAGSRPGDLVLDPFMGAGTTAVVAKRHSRHYLGIELNPDYIRLAEERIANERQPVLWTSGMEGGAA